MLVLFVEEEYKRWDYIGRENFNCWWLVWYMYFINGSVVKRRLYDILSGEWFLGDWYYKRVSIGFCFIRYENFRNGWNWNFKKVKVVWWSN